MNYVVGQANKANKTYFWACVVGYLIAILTTVVVMIIFEHGQPALLYLVPGCLFSVLITALIKGETAYVWSFSEETFLAKVDEKKD